MNLKSSALWVYILCLYIYIISHSPKAKKSKDSFFFCVLKCQNDGAYEGNFCPSCWALGWRGGALIWKLILELWEILLNYLWGFLVVVVASLGTLIVYCISHPFSPIVLFLIIFSEIFSQVFLLNEFSIIAIFFKFLKVHYCVSSSSLEHPILAL